jgi:hypothetical protein
VKIAVKEVLSTKHYRKDGLVLSTGKKLIDFIKVIATNTPVPFN